MQKTINEKLLALYQRTAKGFLATSSLPKAYAGPFLINCPDGYAGLPIKWMYIGQETKGKWSTLRKDSDAAKLMDLHARFNLAETYPRRGAPFWTFGHKLDSRLNPSGPGRSFIWDNIARVGYTDSEMRGRVPDKYLEFWSKSRLLAKEIEILSPDLVVFVTGKYDDLIQNEFPGIKLKPLSANEPVCRLDHRGLPPLSFRSYHPNFLQRNKLKRRVEDYIVGAVEAHRVGR